MKRRIWIGVLVLLAALGLCSAALAADDPIKCSMELSQTKFSGTKDITVSITVSNTGEGDLPGSVTLYYPNGKKVEDFGSPTLTVGASQSWSGTWTVTQKQLEAGKITFKVKYSVYNDAGELGTKTKNFSRSITYEGAVATVEVNRTITPTTAQEGQTVTVIYDVVNSGTVDISGVTIKENSSISKKSGTIDAIAAGEKASYTFTTTMAKKDLTSEATITFTAGSKKGTVKKEAATIKYGKVDLTAKLSADKKGGAPGDTLTLTLILTNSGTVDYTNINVTDPVLGDVFTGLTLAAGKSEAQTKEIAITESVDYMFTVTAMDATETETTVVTDKVSVQAVSAEQKITLTLNASADTETVYSLPGTVHFVVDVINDSAVDVTDVNVYAGTVKLYNFPTILAGETRSFTRDVSVSMAGQYQFNATVKNQLQETETFTSNIIPIAYAQPTAVPTEAPIVTPPSPVYVDVPTTDDDPAMDQVQSTLNTVRVIGFVLAALCAVLVAVGLVRRLQAKRESDAAYDHLERGSYRDYSTPAPKPKGHRAAEEQEDAEDVTVRAEEEEPVFDDTASAAGGDIMEETLRKLYPRGEVPQADEAAYEDEDAAYQETAEDYAAEDALGVDEEEVPAPVTTESAPEDAEEAPSAEETQTTDAEREDAVSAADYRRRRRTQRSSGDE